MMDLLRKLKLRNLDGSPLDPKKLAAGDRVQLFVGDRAAGRVAVAHVAKGDAALAEASRASRIAKGQQRAAAEAAARAALAKEPT